jgi:hypothetical protein
MDGDRVADHRGDTYVFDLDGTLCDTRGRNYADAIPSRDRIAHVNRLHDAGARILIDSARGSVTGENWQERTEAQLAAWGVSYDRLRTGVKFFGDLYIDDKAITSGMFFRRSDDSTT